jgi:hypothetical protein
MHFAKGEKGDKSSLHVAVVIVNISSYWLERSERSERSERRDQPSIFWSDFVVTLYLVHST